MNDMPAPAWRERSCFVVMPYGQRKEVTGTIVDFDCIYEQVLRPAVEAAGLRCDRCDKLDGSGNIHDKMYRLIWTADVALVDISLLNANVFYELGIRHALRTSITVLIRRKGTEVPFNINSLNVIEYDETDAASVTELQRRIKGNIQTGYEQGHVDNDVSKVLGLKITEPARPLSERKVFGYTMTDLPARTLSIITGDLRDIHGIDIWVNSENTNMQMARYYEPFVSSLIRYEGAKKSRLGHVEVDTINKELQKLMGRRNTVDPGTALATSAGELQSKNGVKVVFHVAAVAGGIGTGYRVIESVEQCVTNALKLADSSEFAQTGLRSILFPLLGISTPLRSERDTVASLFEAARSYLKNYASRSKIEQIYFLAWTKSELDLCRAILDSDTRYGAVAT